MKLHQSEITVAFLTFTANKLVSDAWSFVPSALGTNLVRRGATSDPPPTRSTNLFRSSPDSFEWRESLPRMNRKRVSMVGQGLTLLPRIGERASDEVTVLQLPRVEDTDVAVVWFTACDLRTHDHDGLVAASSAAGVIPVYVFDDQVGTLE